MMDKVLGVKNISRGEVKKGLFNALAITWYLDTWYEKIIFVYGGVATFVTIIWLLTKIF